jgi:hypothetical protein
VMREALAGLLKQQMHIARRDAEHLGNGDRVEICITASTFDDAKYSSATGPTVHDALSLMRHTAFMLEQTTD